MEIKIEVSLKSREPIPAPHYLSYSPDVEVQLVDEYCMHSL